MKMTRGGRRSYRVPSASRTYTLVVGCELSTSNMVRIPSGSEFANTPGIDVDPDPDPDPDASPDGAGAPSRFPDPEKGVAGLGGKDGSPPEFRSPLALASPFGSSHHNTLRRVPHDPAHSRAPREPSDAKVTHSLAAGTRPASPVASLCPGLSYRVASVSPEVPSPYAIHPGSYSHIVFTIRLLHSIWPFGAPPRNFAPHVPTTPIGISLFYARNARATRPNGPRQIRGPLDLRVLYASQHLRLSGAAELRAGSPSTRI
ncbi:hypothetical protein RHS01_11176 [Rhizoctonia solani]|uniref:Uncharacterized protein n=1 Tax=Rhizoctonia solani TaxID=456999 RepID=A0A8H7I3G2_9AGAM|nr:hypothetical protein RHS01_11176 [Rhizoctonia solani]